MALVKGTNCGFVTSAPTDDPAGTSTAADNYARATRDTTPTNSIIITEIGWYCDNATEEANFEVGLYNDVSNKPKNLLYVNRTNAKGTTAGWKVVTGLNWELNASTQYWLAFQVDDTFSNTFFNRTTVVGELSASSSAGATELLDLGSFPGTNTDTLYSIYALYTGAPTGTNTKINIGDLWKDITAMKINIGDVWKDVSSVKVNIGDVWKTVF